tara:strand:+ start:2858 stop:4171 length:1314 start_codon:yes stop_codon:yes gene_type:complete
MILNSINQIEDNLRKLHSDNKGDSNEYFNKILKSLPNEYSALINDTFKHKRVPKEFTLSSILFAVSTSIGSTFYIEELGYKNYGNLYFAIVGSRGDTKSEAIKVATRKIKELDDRHFIDYRDEMKVYNKETDEEPYRKQLLIKDASIEATHKIHYENPNSIGICIDEIYSLIDKMGNSSSRDGVQYRSFFLEGYNNDVIDIGRVTSKSFRILESYPTLIGGIQTQFLNKVFANGNLESGFIDRILFVLPSSKNTVLSRGRIASDTILNYNNSIENILSYKNQSEKKDEIIKQFQIQFSDDAKERLFNYVQSLILKQETEKSIIKEYNAKMQISIHKFCIVVHMMRNASKTNFLSEVDCETVELAILLNEFYYQNFMMILSKIVDKNNESVPIEKIVKLAIENNAPQKDVVSITGKDKGNISKLFKKVNAEMQITTNN